MTYIIKDKSNWDVQKANPLDFEELLDYSIDVSSFVNISELEYLTNEITKRPASGLDVRWSKRTISYLTDIIAGFKAQYMNFDIMPFVNLCGRLAYSNSPTYGTFVVFTRQKIPKRTIYSSNNKFIIYICPVDQRMIYSINLLNVDSIFVSTMGDVFCHDKIEEWHSRKVVFPTNNFPKLPIMMDNFLSDKELPLI